MTTATTTEMTTGLMTWFPPNTMHSLGWALLHFLWQGTALAAVATGVMAVCRRASLRYVVGVAALTLMLAAPLATFFYYFQDSSGAADAVKPSPGAAAAWPIARGNAAASGPASSSGTGSVQWWRKLWPNALSLDALPWLVEAWLLGVALLSLRTAGGFFLLERERRRRPVAASPQIIEICHALQRRLGIGRAIAFCECRWLQAPAVIGWFRPMVFLPVTALTGLTEEQLQSVIAHELAHIRRFDPFVNIFQVWVETLLFYHPAVWWLNRKIRVEREHCCDDVAVSVCGNAVEYARALTLMEEWRTTPALAMAANRGPLTERIVRLLGLKNLGVGARGVGLTGSLLCLTAAIFAGNALLGMAHPTPQAAFFAQAAANAPANPAPEPAARTAPSAKPSPAHRPSSAPPAGSYIDQMKAAGLGDLTADQLIALKIQDVTPEYVRELREQGVNANAEKIVAMRIQGITPEYVRDLHASGLNPDVDHLIAMKIQGADAEFYRGIKDAGLQPDVDHLIAMKIQGLTPEYLRAIRAAGLTVTADQAIALKIQDVTPTYLKEMHEQGIDPRTDDAIAMRIQSVTPEYVRAIHALGLQPSTRELIAMRVQDVTPEYIKALQAAGFKVEVNDAIRAKVQDVTPEFIERARQHGFKDLPLDKLIRLRQSGILDSKADL
jgi:beta-lactamase regulating signal transducer with metallopeptidase domain